MAKNKREQAERLLAYLALTFLALLFLLPLLWVFAASFNPQAAQALQIPGKPSLSNYKAILLDYDTMKSFLNGALLSGTQTLIVCITALLAAYPLSRYKLRFKRPVLLTALFMTSLPITAVMVPVYRFFVWANLQDNLLFAAIFMAASSLPYAIWMSKNFMDAVSRELEEAAWVDGATPLQAVFKIIAPLMLPGLATVAIFTFSGSWGNFFVPYILINSNDKLPASIRIYQYFGNYGLINYGRLAAFSVLYAMPSALLYILAQKYMSKGFSLSGANKG